MKMSYRKMLDLMILNTLGKVPWQCRQQQNLFIKVNIYSFHNLGLNWNILTRIGTPPPWGQSFNHAATG